MSTNYYFVHTRSKEIVKKFELRVSNLTVFTRSQLKNAGIEDEGIDTMLKRMSKLEAEPMTIHIGKTSGGRKPLLAIQPRYSGVSGMKKWYEANKSEWHIEDEYENQLTWDELSVALLEHNKDNPSALSNLEKGDDYVVIEGYEWSHHKFS